MRKSIVPGIAVLQKEVRKGLCVFCEEKIPKRGRSPIGVQCGAPECVKSYHRMYRTLRTERLWAEGLTSTGKLPVRNIARKHREETT